jgi:hypothetical protein
MIRPKPVPPRDIHSEMVKHVGQREHTSGDDCYKTLNIAKLVSCELRGHADKWFLRVKELGYQAMLMSNSE